MEMGYCYSLYTPDLKQRKTGKFVVCNKLFLSNDDSFKDITKNIIGFYENSYFGKYLSDFNSVTMLNEEQCKLADVYTNDTFFTDFLREYDCSGMLVQIE